jgi:hypothetical protein
MGGNTLTFKHENIKGLMIHAISQWQIALRPNYGDEPGSTKKGFWLVGDTGVYLMHNGAAHEGVESQPLVYAEECNPEAMEFDSWWEAKRRTFGGDDGVEFIDAETVRQCVLNAEDMVISFTPDQFVIEGRKAAR